MKNIFIFAFFICIFPILSVQAEDKELTHEDYLRLIDEYKNEPVPIIPDEHLFDGMKMYNKEDIKFSEEDLTAYDLNGNLITGAVIMNPRVTKTFKNGKVDGPSLAKNEDYVMFANFIHEGGKYSLVALYQEFLAGQLINEYKNNGKYFYGRRYDSSGRLIWDTINDNNMGIIIRAYDKKGNKTIEIDMFVPSVICFLKDGTQRDATPTEVENFFAEQDKVVAQSYGEHEFNFSCQE